MLELLRRSYESIGLQARVPREQPALAGFYHGEVSRSYKDLELSSAAEIHAVVYGCISRIASTAAAVPLIVFREGMVVPEDDPLTRVLRLPSGSSQQTVTQQDLIEAIVWHLLLLGNSFVEVVSDRRGRPVELWPIIADDVKIVISDDARIEKYIIRIGSNHIPMNPNEILHFRLFHPRNAFFGLSPLAAVREGIITDLKSINYNRTVFENLAVPAGILKTDQFITKAQAREYEQEWESKFRGAHGKTAVLGRGLDFKAISLPQKDVQFIQQRRLTREEIQMVLGVPNSILFTSESATFAYAYVEQQAFHEQVVFPILSKIEATLNTKLMPRFAPNVKVQFDMNRVPASLQATEQRIAAHQRALSSGIPIDMIWQLIWNREAPFDDETNAKAFIPANLIPIDAVNRAVTAVTAVPGNTENTAPEP